MTAFLDDLNDSDLSTASDYTDTGSEPGDEQGGQFDADDDIKIY